jgi:glycerophosphoryl diester phosphodiesterase
VQNFFKHREDLPLYQSWYLTRLISSRAVRPDFIAFRFGDIDHLAMRRMNRIIRRSALPAAVWTIRTPDDYRAALDSGCIPIFEQFDPDSRPEVKQ